MRDSDTSRPSGRFFFYNLGCPKNLVDAERVALLLERAGWTEAGAAGEAELIVVTTCAFISRAEEESIETILQAASQKESWQKLAVLGCLVTREGSRLNELLPEVDIFLPVAEMDRLVDEIGAVRAPSDGSLAPRRRFTPPHLAYIKVAEGCSNRCSYCTIPSIRGDLRSRRADAIVAEADGLAAAGVKELVVIAQDTAAWGMDSHGAVPGGRRRAGDIYDIVERIDRSGSLWIRLMYLHPRHIDAERTARLLDDGSIIPYLDIPVQHASDAVLERMGRGYRRVELLGLFSRLRDAHEGLVLRTTVMTGFPGETGDDVRILTGFLEEVQFDHVGVFEYSPERGTPAARMARRVPPAVASERRDMLIELQMDISQNRLERRVGTRERVLVDRLVDPDEATGAGIWGVGRYYGQAYEIDGVTYLTGPIGDTGDFVSCRVAEAGPYDLFAGHDRDLG